MNRKPAGVPRTWHSLWDEMFSAFSASDSNAGEAWYADLEDAASEQLELLQRREVSNDNAHASLDDAARTQPCIPIDPDSLRDWDDD